MSTGQTGDVRLTMCPLVRLTMWSDWRCQADDVTTGQADDVTTGLAGDMSTRLAGDMSTGQASHVFIHISVVKLLKDDAFTFMLLKLS